MGEEKAALHLMDNSVETVGDDNSLALITPLRDQAKLYALTFRFDAAVANLDRVIALGEGQNVEHTALARYYKQRGDHIFLLYEWDRVLADYNHAIMLNPTYAGAYFARGILYYTQGPRAQAIGDFERYLVLAGTDAPQAAQARAYITDIQRELEALGGDDTGAFSPTATAP